MLVGIQLGADSGFGARKIEVLLPVVASVLQRAPEALDHDLVTPAPLAVALIRTTGSAGRFR